jgi:hypothetical protein
MAAAAETEKWRQHGSSMATAAEQRQRLQWRQHLSGSKQQGGRAAGGRQQRQGSVSGRAAVSAAAEQQISGAEAL